jgi:glycosyltransferase domain-containing protein
MNLIVIPTYNRSAKLRRVLGWYRDAKLAARIVILDASDEATHQEANRRTVESCAAFATRLETVGQNSIVARLLTFLEGIGDEFVALGNDEDVYFPEFLEYAFDFLGRNPEYVVATGRYITFAKPVLGLRRITYWTDTFVGFDVDESEAALRVINFQRFNSGGVPTMYWSVRRRDAFIVSCRSALRLRFGSAHELIDQITSCVLGKVSISNRPMLLRDESRVKYTGYNDRDSGVLYIGQEDLHEIDEIASEMWSGDIAVSVRSVTSWYRAKPGGESYQSRLRDRMYCRFGAAAEAQETRWLTWLRSTIRWTCTLAIVVSQVIAFMYFFGYMRRTGRGAKFWRMTKSIPVHQRIST